MSEFYAQNGTFPASVTNTAASASNTVMYALGASTGKYVSGVTVVKAAITVTYSNVAPYVANKAINADTLALTPYLSANNDIVWVCGMATAPTTATLDASVTAGTTNVPPAVLAGCLPRLMSWLRYEAYVGQGSPSSEGLLLLGSQSRSPRSRYANIGGYLTLIDRST